MNGEIKFTYLLFGVYMQGTRSYFKSVCVGGGEGGWSTLISVKRSKWPQTAQNRQVHTNQKVGQLFSIIHNNIIYFWEIQSLLKSRTEIAQHKLQALAACDTWVTWYNHTWSTCYGSSCHECDWLNGGAACRLNAIPSLVFPMLRKPAVSWFTTLCLGRKVWSCGYICLLRPKNVRIRKKFWRNLTDSHIQKLTSIWINVESFDPACWDVYCLVLTTREHGVYLEFIFVVYDE